MGHENITSCVKLPRGKTTMLQTNDFFDKTEIYKGVKCLHREKTKY